MADPWPKSPRARQSIGYETRWSAESNCLQISRVLTESRCLLVLDPLRYRWTHFLPAGRSSVLFTTDPLRISDPPETLTAARSLASASRLAEAYELLYRLLNSGVETRILRPRTGLDL